jgi:tagatose 6-phosphate kinase
MTFDALRAGGVNRATAVRQFASGKSTNAARVLKTLGDDVRATGFLGGDLGKFFRADLDSAGISHDFVDVSPQTRMCITLVEQSGGATELIEESKPLDPRDFETLLSKIEHHAKSAGVVILSGTLPPGAPADFYARCVRGANKTSRVILDAVGKPLIEAIKEKPFVVKPNQSEIARTLGIPIESDSQLRDAMCDLIARGATWVVCTRGTAPTLVTDGKEFWQVDTPKVKAINPIGSGDSFAAGLASGISKGLEIPRACILAVACGAANAMTADAGHVNPEDVHTLFTSAGGNA